MLLSSAENLLISCWLTVVACRISLSKKRKQFLQAKEKQNQGLLESSLFSIARFAGRQEAGRHATLVCVVHLVLGKRREDIVELNI